MNEHLVRWIAPQPLWGRFAAAGDKPGSASALNADDQYRPALLRFASDDFMPQVLALLAKDPGQLGGYIARPETWRSPQADGTDLVAKTQLPRPAQVLQRLKAARTPRSAVERSGVGKTDPHESTLGLPAPRTLPLKLYQPVHQRHYLVAAGLVCGVAGLPERALATGGREQVGFVLRRLLPSSVNASLNEECAYVKDATSARWQRTGTLPGAANASLVDGEEMLPLFGLSFADDASRPRRMLAGTIPVGRRDEYLGVRVDVAAAPANPPPAPPNSVAARKEQFKAEVVEPWKNLVRSAVKVQFAGLGLPGNDAPTSTQKTTSRRTANVQLQGQSWLVLLDFADYVALHLPDIWSAVLAAPDGSRNLPTDPANQLYHALCQAKMSPSLATALQDATPGGTIESSLAAALIAVRDYDGVPATRDKLESAASAFSATSAAADWPAFKFLLAGVDGSDQAAGPYTAFSQPSASTTSTVDGGFDGREDEDPKGPGASTTQAAQAQAAADHLDGLVKLVVAALPASTEQDGKAPPIPYAAKLQRDAIAGNNVNDPGLFVVRCIFRRCDCGPLQVPLLSASSQQFQLAGFFDPDAPARPIRIALPLDTTPAGLRKFSRNTAFQVSNVLCGQMSRAKGLGLVDLVLSVLPWPFHKDLSVDVGDMGPCKNGNVDIGMICSLSIPIITICAFILLMMIVLVLDLIFRWIPYFVICFPLPGLKAKKAP